MKSKQRWNIEVCNDRSIDHAWGVSSKNKKSCNIHGVRRTRHCVVSSVRLTFYIHPSIIWLSWIDIPSKLCCSLCYASKPLQETFFSMFNLITNRVRRTHRCVVSSVRLTFYIQPSIIWLSWFCHGMFSMTVYFGKVSNTYLTSLIHETGYSLITLRWTFF